MNHESTKDSASNQKMMGEIEITQNNLYDFLPDEVRTFVDNQRSEFNPTAAKNLIRYFHYRFQDGNFFDNKKLHPEERAFLNYIDHALSLIVKNKSADVAFGLTLGRGKYQREDTLGRDMQLAAYVVLLMREGENWESAIVKSAERFYAKGGDRVAEEAYGKFGNAFKPLSDNDLKAILSDEHSPQS
jgi:hypothetical protein